MNTINRLTELNDKSVWIITKQSVNFEDAYKAAKLFSEIPDKENTNIEQYFRDNYQKYGISTDRHRMLVIPQYYGLITKTPFYSRGGTYNNENITAVFEALSKTEIGSKEYNTLKTEQLLKLKIHSIIDTKDNNHGYKVLPIIFIYEVLRRLEDKYGIQSISLDYLYSYVMTCSSFDEVDLAVECIGTKQPISPYVDRYKDLSRVLTSIKENTNIFVITSDSISLNREFDVYFFNKFIDTYDLDDLHGQLSRDVDYAYFLTNVQGFNVNLIDVPEEVTEPNIEPKKEISASISDDDESDYQEKVDSIKDTNINEDAGEEAYSNAPIKSSSPNAGRKFKTNPMLGKIAIKKAYYSCEFDADHITFISRKTKKNFMEAHHLVPVKYSAEIWEKYHINVDCVENIFSICPNCHRAIHNGNKETQRQVIAKLYGRALPKYRAIGFEIKLDEVYELYGI